MVRQFSGPPAYISPDDAAKHIGVTRRTIDRRIADGSLPAYRAGARSVRIRVADLEAFLRPIDVG